jgi:hypothetical protein
MFGFLKVFAAKYYFTLLDLRSTYIGIATWCESRPLTAFFFLFELSVKDVKLYWSLPHILEETQSTALQHILAALSL